MRRPGIEPGADEWESSMLPLHQRRVDIYVKIAKIVIYIAPKLAVRGDRRSKRKDSDTLSDSNSFIYKLGSLLSHCCNSGIFKST